jgi:hypothetical protein
MTTKNHLQHWESIKNNPLSCGYDIDRAVNSTADKFLKWAGKSKRNKQALELAKKIA